MPQIGRSFAILICQIVFVRLRWLSYNTPSPVIPWDICYITYTHSRHSSMRILLNQKDVNPGSIPTPSVRGIIWAIYIMSDSTRLPQWQLWNISFADMGQVCIWRRIWVVPLTPHTLSRTYIAILRNRYVQYSCSPLSNSRVIIYYHLMDLFWSSSTLRTAHSR